AENALAAVMALKNEAQALRGEIAGKLSIGTVSDPDFIRLGVSLNALVERLPLIEIELHHQVSGVALERVRDGALDASFYYGEVHGPSVAGLHLRKIGYCVAAPAAWKERVENADWNELAAQPWIVTPSVSTHNHLVRELFREQA